MDERDIENYIFRLILHNKDLSDLEGAIRELISSCQGADEIEVVKHVLKEMLIFDAGRIDHPIGRMASGIKSRAIAMPHVNFGLVAMAWGPDSDSSQSLIYILKPLLREISNLKIFNSVPEYLKGNRQAENPAAILVDDFVGTGKTIENRVKHILGAADERGISASCSSVILFGMEDAINYLQLCGIEIAVIHEMKAGLSGYFSGPDLYSRVAAMKRLEARLAAYLNGAQLPSMGYGGAEAMFCFARRNAPNSNFPILWWPQNAAGEARSTIMTRYET